MSMSRYRNDTGGVLTVNDLMRQVGPNEEFDYDPETYGVIPGCALVDAPQTETGAGQGDGTGDAGEQEDTAAAAAGGDAPRTRRRKGAGDEGKETA
jgi:hypothetical protein